MPNRRFLVVIIPVFALIWVITSGESALLNVKHHWQIALTMAFGSFIAGATSEGGGAVAFPVFTKLLAISPGDAKIFALAIQSVGMSAASIIILAFRIPIEWRVIRWASLGGLIGIAVGAGMLAPSIPAALVKMSFTVMVTAFVIPLSYLNRSSYARHFRLSVFGSKERCYLFLAGAAGGIMSGLVGNGIDIVVFSLMVLLFRICETVATPTSVVLMAINAIVGFAMHYFWLGGVTEEILAYWSAAVPVVIIGAPLGAIFCSRLNRRTVASILIGLILIELVSSLLIIPLDQITMLTSSLVFLFFCGVYYAMCRSQSYRPV